MQTRNSSVDETLPLEPRIANSLASSCLRNDVLASRLQTACFSQFSAIYSTLTNAAFDLLGAGSTGTACL